MRVQQDSVPEFILLWRRATDGSHSRFRDWTTSWSVCARLPSNDRGHAHPTGERVAKGGLAHPGSMLIIGRTRR